MRVLFSRYLSGEENEKKHKYNFWHGVLADYFEGVDDMDRKAEVRKILNIYKEKWCLNRRGKTSTEHQYAILYIIWGLLSECQDFCTCSRIRINVQLQWSNIHSWNLKKFSYALSLRLSLGITIPSWEVDGQQSINEMFDGLGCLRETLLWRVQYWSPPLLETSEFFSFYFINSGS